MSSRAASPAARERCGLLVGFVLGPPLVGLLSAVTTLPTALALLSVLAAAVAVSGPMALSRSRSSSPARTGRLPA